MAEPLELIYGLQGTDTAAVRALRDRLEQRVVAENGSVQVLTDRTAADVIALIGQAELALGPRLVIVTDAGKFKSADAKKIAAALTTAAPQTVLCVIASGTALAAPLAAACKSHGGLVVRDVADDPAAQILAAAKRAKVKLTADAVAFLAGVDQVSPDALARDLDKLSVWADGKVADAAAVRALCVFDQADTQPWALLEAVSVRDGRKATGELIALWSCGEHPVRVAGLIKGRLRRLSQVRALAAKGAGAPAVARMTDTKPWQAAKLLAAAKKWDLAELAQASARMEQTERDIMIAGPGPAGRMLLERAVPAICARRR